MCEYLVNFVKGRVLNENAGNLVFNRASILIPRVGDKMQFPRKYWDQTGSNAYTVTSICYQYQDEDNSAILIWVFVDDLGFC